MLLLQLNATTKALSASSGSRAATNNAGHQTKNQRASNLHGLREFCPFAQVFSKSCNSNECNDEQLLEGLFEPEIDSPAFDMVDVSAVLNNEPAGTCQHNSCPVKSDSNLNAPLDTLPPPKTEASEKRMHGNSENKFFLEH